MIELKGRTKTAVIENERGSTLLVLALKHDVDWGFSCARGTCARCRCLITEGADQLAAPTDEELDRLEPEEMEQGYRLGCQAVVKGEGRIAAKHKPYF